MSNTNTIPYNTWGGGRNLSRTTTLNSSPQRVDNPYTISNLQYNCKVNTFLYDNSYITNMAYYAQQNITNHIRITSIPSGHLPTDIDTSLAQDWSSAFSTCQSIKSFPDPFYNTSNAINMGGMFSLNYNISTVPNFDTSNVTDMSTMFYRCRLLDTIPNFNTSKVTDMSHMFHNCMYRLVSIPNLDTSNVTDMRYMFDDCWKFSNIPILNTSKARLLNYMFNRCVNIQGDLYIESNNVEGAINLFANTPNYTKNIYCHGNTNTYNTIASAMGGTYNANWNTSIYTMEDNYANIEWSGNGIYRFPTNKIAMYFDWVDPVIIEVSPYTDYQLNMTSFGYGYNISHNDTVWYSFGDVPGYSNSRFQFFKDIPNMTANVVDII